MYTLYKKFKRMEDAYFLTLFVVHFFDALENVPLSGLCTYMYMYMYCCIHVHIYTLCAYKYYIKIIVLYR